MTDTPRGSTPDEALSWKSVKWRNAAGWLVVAIIAFRYLVHPIANVLIVMQGGEALEEIPDVSLTDVAAIVGLPIGGGLADKMGETS